MGLRRDGRSVPGQGPGQGRGGDQGHGERCCGGMHTWQDTQLVAIVWSGGPQSLAEATQATAA